MRKTTQSEREDIAASIRRIEELTGLDQQIPSSEEVARISPPWTFGRLNEISPPSTENNGEWTIEWSGWKLDPSRERGVKGEFKAINRDSGVIFISKCPTENPDTVYLAKPNPMADDIVAEDATPTLDSHASIFMFAMAASMVHLNHLIDSKNGK